MDKERRIKKILYITLTIACAIAGVLLYYAVTKGLLYPNLFDNLLIKSIIVLIPIIFSFVIENYFEHYMPGDNPIVTSIGMALVCLFIGWVSGGFDGGKTSIEFLGMTLSTKLFCILVFAIPLGVSYIAGLWSIFTGDLRKTYPSAPPRENTYTPPSTTDYSDCGPGGMPKEQGPNYIPHYDIEPGTMCND